MIDQVERPRPPADRFRDPPSNRIMFDPPGTVIATLEAAPNRWLLVAGGEYKRQPTFAQSAYQIRKGLVVGFPLRDDGEYRTKVSSARSTRHKRTFECEFYMMFVPTPTHHPIG